MRCNYMASAPCSRCRGSLLPKNVEEKHVLPLRSRLPHGIPVPTIRLDVQTIDDKVWRIHGLGKQTRSQESQIHQGLKSVIHSTIYLTLTNLTEIKVNLAFSVPFLNEK